MSRNSEEKSKVIVEIDIAQAEANLKALKARAEELKVAMRDMVKNGDEWKKSKEELDGINKEIKETQAALRNRVDIVINGELAGATIRDLEAASRKLNSEIKNLPIGSDEFVKKSEQLHVVKDRLQEVQEEVKGTGGIWTKFTDGFLNSLTEIGGALGLYFGVSQITDFFKGSFEAFSAYEKTMTQLRSQITLANGETTEQFNALKEQAEKLQGVFSNEAIAKTQLYFAQFGLGSKDIEKALPIIIDFAAATGQTLPEASEKFARGIEGQAKSLKVFGIEVDKNQSTAERFGSVLDQLTTKFKGQADLIASSTTAGALDKLAASWEGFKERVGSVFAPALTGLFNFIAGTVDAKAATEKLTEEWKKAKDETDNLQKNITPLINRYDELKTKTSLSKEEQSELKDIIKKVSEALPGAITGFDKYGNAIDISTNSAREFIQAQKDMAAEANKKTIKQAEQDLEKYQLRMETLVSDLKSGTTSIEGLGASMQGLSSTSEKAKLNPEDIRVFQKEIIELQHTINGLQTQIKVFKGEPIVDENSVKSSIDETKASFSELQQWFKVHEFDSVIDSSKNKTAIKNTIDYEKASFSELQTWLKVHENDTIQSTIDFQKLKINELQQYVKEHPSNSLASQTLEKRQADAEKEAKTAKESHDKMVREQESYQQKITTLYDQLRDIKSSVINEESAKEISTLENKYLKEIEIAEKYRKLINEDKSSSTEKKEEVNDATNTLKLALEEKFQREKADLIFKYDQERSDHELNQDEQNIKRDHDLQINSLVNELYEKKITTQQYNDAVEKLTEESNLRKLALTEGYTQQELENVESNADAIKAGYQQDYENKLKALSEKHLSESDYKTESEKLIKELNEKVVRLDQQAADKRIDITAKMGDKKAATEKDLAKGTLNIQEDLEHKIFKIQSDIEEKKRKKEEEESEKSLNEYIKQVQKKEKEDLDAIDKRLAQIEAAGNKEGDEYKKLAALRISVEEDANEKIAHARTVHNLKLLAELAKAIDSAGEIFSTFIQVQNNYENATLQREKKEVDNDKKTNDIKRKNLDDRLKHDAISQKDYDAQIKELDDADQKRQDDYNKQEADVKKKQFERQKAADLEMAVIRTAVSIATALSQFPGVPLTIPNGILAGILGGAQIAAIASQPTPEFESGAKTITGIVEGPSHSQGGIKLVDSKTGQVKGEMQGSEGIFSIPMYENNPEIIDAIFDAAGKSITPEDVPGFISKVHNFVPQYENGKPAGDQITPSSSASNPPQRIISNERIDSLKESAINVINKTTIVERDTALTEFKNLTELTLREIKEHATTIQQQTDSTGNPNDTDQKVIGSNAIARLIEIITSSSLDTEQKAIITASIERLQKVIGSDSIERLQKVIGSDELERLQKVIGSDERLQKVIGSDELERLQKVIGSDEIERLQKVIGSDERLQKVIGSDENERLQKVIGSDELERLLTTTDPTAPSNINTKLPASEIAEQIFTERRQHQPYNPATKTLQQVSQPEGTEPVPDLRGGGGGVSVERIISPANTEAGSEPVPDLRGGGGGAPVELRGGGGGAPVEKRQHVPYNPSLREQLSEEESETLKLKATVSLSAENLKEREIALKEYREHSVKIYATHKEKQEIESEGLVQLKQNLVSANNTLTRISEEKLIATQKEIYREKLSGTISDFDDGIISRNIFDEVKTTLKEQLKTNTLSRKVNELSKFAEFKTQISPEFKLPDTGSNIFNVPEWQLQVPPQLNTEKIIQNSRAENISGTITLLKEMGIIKKESSATLNNTEKEPVSPPVNKRLEETLDKLHGTLTAIQTKGVKGVWEHRSWEEGKNDVDIIKELARFGK
jgi:hypothetical protein